MKLNNNVMLITGGTSGIGLELVRRFYSLGNKLIVSSSNESNLRWLKEQFPTIDTIQCNLGDQFSVKGLIDICIEKYQDINVIINNAGIQNNYLWIEESNGLEKILNEITINFTSPFQLIYGLLPILEEKHNAAIVNVSSGLGLVPKKTAPIYCASKAAMHIGTISLRLQLENTSIKVFEIIPPLVDTNMTKGRGRGKISPEQLVAEFLENFKKNKLESNIGKVKILRSIVRISPRWAQQLMKNGL